MRRVRVLVFRVNGDRIATGNDLESGTVTAPFLLVWQTNEREACQGGALAGSSSVLMSADVALSLSSFLKGPMVAQGCTMVFKTF